jgi:hypothetical protein
MQVLVKAKRRFEGSEYAPGIHEMPDAYKEHWFFLAEVQNGIFVINPTNEQTVKILKAPEPKILGVDMPRVSSGEQVFKDIKSRGLVPNEVDDESEKTDTLKPASFSQSDEKIVETEESEDEDEEEIIQPASDKKNSMTTATTKNRGR